MKHRTISEQCREWISHSRSCASPERLTENIRLTHDQAMRLCFELSRELYGQLSEHNRSGGPTVGSTQDRALAAYAAGRPWDLLAGASLFGHLVQYEKAPRRAPTRS